MSLACLSSDRLAAGFTKAQWCAPWCRATSKASHCRLCPCQRCAFCMPPPPACDEQDDQWGNTRYFLAIVSVFKNEADVIREWVEHHLWQGVEHFFLVDNGSTDKWREALGERMPHVSVARNETLYSQVSHLNSWLSRLQAEVRWVLSIDVDEYVYAHPSRGSESIDAYLRHVEQADCKARKISLAWHQFGSSL